MTDSSAGEGAGLGPRLGVGREAEVYTWGAGAVLKLYRPGFHGHQAEALALTSLAGRSVAPGLVDVVHHDGRPGLVLERVAGVDMLDLLRRQPWRVLPLARALADAHVTVHGVPAPADLPDVRQVLAARVEAAALPGELRGFALRMLDGLPSGDRLCHGDYHPGNVMVDDSVDDSADDSADDTADDTVGARRVAVIDWPNAARGVPEADHARALLLLRWADPVPGTPLLTRGLMTAGRTLLARGYARAYTRGTHRPLRDVGSWLVVQVAARLAEGIGAERGLLVDRLRRAWREAGRLDR